MAMKKHTRPRLLSSTRPRHVKPRSSLSSQTTRELIRTHHTLRKQLTSALARGDGSGAGIVQAKIDAAGGLHKYQEASIQGQSAERGGDTSKVLVEWLSALKGHESEKWRMLEVGALKTDNACSRSGLFKMKRIDLHSQHPDIEEQDFMNVPLPLTENLDDEGFDIVNLSLVVNFVGDPVQRGEMLKHVESFLRPCSREVDETKAFFPALFLVLPAPCVKNSRYLDEVKLEEIMRSLGYTQIRRKLSTKLVSYLWKFEGHTENSKITFKKVKLRSGTSRNNFAIVLG